MKLFHTLALAFAFALGTGSAPAKLSVGDKAPELKAGEWVQGDAVKEFSPDNVYVVEFWATWCGPCVATIPHLDEMHEALKDKGVVFIGQNCMEEDREKVKKFVSDMGEKMSYRVATDNGDQMAKTWLQAAEQPGIPCAFVVGKDGKIAWIGHPQMLKADMLAQVAAGTFDARKAAEDQAKAMSAMQELQKKSQELNSATAQKEWDKALAIIDEIEKENPDMADQLAGTRVSVALKKGDSELAAKCAARILETRKDLDAASLDELAWGIATELSQPSGPVLEVAARAARAAVAKSESKNAGMIDTLARVLFLQGNSKEAIATQEKAVAAADDTLVDDLKKTLECYKAGKLRDIHN